MLPKINRLSVKLVTQIFKEGKFLNSPSLTFKFLYTDSKIPQISFIAPKSIAKLAVKRNRLRRLGYTALQKQVQNSPLGIKGVFVFKKSEDNVLILENEIKNIFSKIS